MMIALKNISIIYLLSLMTISCNEPVSIDSIWNKDVTNAREIIDTYESARKKIGRGKEELHILNTCYYIWNSGEYMFKCKGKNEDITELPKHAKRIKLDDNAVMEFMKSHNAERFTDHYFTLQAMRNGYSFDDSRDGLTVTVFYPIRGLNSNDYNKLKEVFSCNNKVLHEAFLKKLIHPLNNNGCNKEFLEIRDLIQENVADSELKRKVLQIYEIYVPIMPGTHAPNVVFKDTKGNRFAIEDFKGKVLVMDIWATWCSSCLKNMPKFMELREQYAGNELVEFVTVSTDSDDIRERWLAAIEKHKMNGMLNLMPDRSTEEHFENRYNISGVPRYIVIDKGGNIISTFAPKPGKDLIEIIEKALKD